MHLDDASNGSYLPKLTSSAVDIPTYFQPQWKDASTSSSLGFVSSDTLTQSNGRRIELAKITEYETWSIDQPTNSYSGAKTYISASLVLAPTRHTRIGIPPIRVCLPSKIAFSASELRQQCILKRPRLVPTSLASDEETECLQRVRGIPFNRYHG